MKNTCTKAETPVSIGSVIAKDSSFNKLSTSVLKVYDRVTTYVLTEDTITNDKVCIKVFFRGLYKRTTKDTVEKALLQYGELNYIRLPYCNSKRKNMGYGFAVFKDANVAIRILNNVKRILIDDRIIELSPFDRKSNVSGIKAAQIPQTSTSLQVDINSTNKRNITTNYKESQIASYLTNQETHVIGTLRCEGFNEINQSGIHSIKPTRFSYFNPSSLISYNHSKSNISMRLRKN